MVENLESIYLLDKNFIFVQRKKDKLIYKNINNNLEQINILELTFSELEQRINKIDIHTIEAEETVESLHIIRGIDGVTELNYYPLKAEAVNIDNKTDLYNISIYKTYSEVSDKLYPELYEIELVKKGHKKHKFLTKSTLSNVIFETKNQKNYRITSPSINKINQLTQFLIPNILKIETNLFNKEVKEEPKIIAEEEYIEEIVENYPLSLYVYDRTYNLVGIKNNAIIYRNTEDEIIELEIYFNNNKDKIREIRFIDYKFIEVEEVKYKAKRKIIRIIADDNKIKASLCNRQKESVYLNHHILEDVIIKADATISSKNKEEEVRLNIISPLKNFELIESNLVGVDFVDKNNEEYLLTAKSYMLFKNLILYGKNIIRHLENKLIYDDIEEKFEKSSEKLLIKK